MVMAIVYILIVGLGTDLYWLSDGRGCLIACDSGILKLVEQKVGSRGSHSFKLRFKATSQGYTF